MKCNRIQLHSFFLYLEIREEPHRIREIYTQPLACCQLHRNHEPHVFEPTDTCVACTAPTPTPRVHASAATAPKEKAQGARTSPAPRRSQCGAGRPRNPSAAACGLRTVTRGAPAGPRGPRRKAPATQTRGADPRSGSGARSGISGQGGDAGPSQASRRHVLCDDSHRTTRMAPRAGRRSVSRPDTSRRPLLSLPSCQRTA